MLKYFRRNQKKLLAIFGVLLMVVFILPATTKNPRSSNDPVQGRIGEGEQAQNILSSEAWQAKQEWDQLKRLSVQQMVTQTIGGRAFGQRPEIVPLVYQLGVTDRDGAGGGLMNYAVNQIDSRPDLYYLLLQREAGRMGVAVSSEQVAALMAMVSQSPGAPNLNDPDVAQPLREELTRFLMAKEAFERNADAIKISEPARQQAMAAQLQTIKLKVVELDAKDMLGSVPAPTTQQVADQFKAYASKFADAPDNASGFGYRYGNRVKFQYIAVPYDAVEKAVENRRTDYDWEVAEYRYYNEHAGQFATTRPAATNPTQAPLALGPTSEPAAARPTTAPFEEVRDKVKAAIVRPEARDLAGAITNRIASTLAADWAAYSRAQTSAAPTTAPASSVGVAYDSPDYLPRLADDIQKRFGVLPKTVLAQDEFRSADDLAKLPGIGAAMASRGIDFPTYTTLLGEAFVPAAQRDSSDVLHLYEPSQPLHDAAEATYFVRLTAMEPAHAPADVSEVAAKAAADVRLTEAMKQTRQLADDLVAKAQNRGFQATADAAKKKVYSVGPISNRATYASSIVGYEVSDASAQTFITEAFKLLNVAARTNDPHAVTVIELPRDGKVLVAQLDGATPAWTKDRAVLAEAYVTSQLTEGLRRQLVLSWFDHNAIINRMHYVEVRAKPSKQEEPAQPAPQAPNQPAL